MFRNRNIFLTTTINPVAIDAGPLLEEGSRAHEIERACRAAQNALRRGDDVVICTSRQVISGPDADSSLKIGRQVAEGMTAVVRGISVRPSFVVAKGGITSSVVVTEAFDARRAWVAGQILPGVPVWRLGPESRFPKLIYVVFPGNVGGPSALADVFEKLRSTRPAPLSQ